MQQQLQQPQQQLQGQGQGGQQRGQLSVVCTSRPPLYFQHEGHSRTIIGIERRLKQGEAAAGVLLDLSCLSLQAKVFMCAKRRLSREV